MGDWERNLAEFGIDPSGLFFTDDVTEPRIPPPPPPRSTDDDRKRKREPEPIVVVSEAREGSMVKRHTYRLDFIQAIACAQEEELTTLMYIAIDVVVRECHKDRVIGGDVETALEGLTKNWKQFCTGCTMLKAWLHRREEEARRKMESKEEEEAQERVKRRKRTRALLLGKLTELREDSIPGNLWGETNAEKQEYQELLDIFGSDELIDIGRTPEEIYQDTINIRIGTILCMLSRSKALQRLACVGKFYAESLGHEYRYVRIPKDSLDEFLAVTNILKNAFMTQQTPPGLFVRCIQKMVIRGGVHGFITNVLNVSRELETVRLSVTSQL